MKSVTSRIVLVLLAVVFLLNACNEPTSIPEKSENPSQTPEASTENDVLYIRGAILHFLEDPAKVDVVQSFQYFENGLLIVKDGKVVEVGPYSALKSKIKGEVIDYSGKLIMPGFIDTHIHFPQVEMMAAYGEQLLEWLDTYTFPTERKYKDKAYSKKMSKFFLDQLLKNGTTSALVFATVHPESAEAFFEESHNRNMRMIAGKVLMDRNAPDYLLDNPEKGYLESKELIEKWHKKGRQLYAVTPRFAPTSTPEQLYKAGELMKEFPDVWMHTHMSENTDEIAWVNELFPDRNGYMDVYHHYGLTGPRSVFAHSIHLTDEEWKLFQETHSAVSHCPTSNLFLGSGFFNLKKADSLGIKVGIGTDVGAGTSLSQFVTLNEGYKIQQLQRNKLSAFKGFYLATLGGARSLELDNYIGNFETGKEADFIVVDFAATDLQEERISHSPNVEDKLFALMMLGDERNVAATYIMGKKLYERPAN
ncbi:guanine deaminase [bacterium SCSIO 12741]|nr:guanine deaminase [bacterium SCSIO 12741]